MWRIFLPASPLLQTARNAGPQSVVADRVMSLEDTLAADRGVRSFAARQTDIRGCERRTGAAAP